MFHKIITLIVTAVLGLALNGPAIASDAGAVYAMTNAADGNEIVIYDRANDGHLTLAGQVATGGDGSGVVEPDQPPDDALGAGNPLILSKNKRFLLAVNAGSNEISVFRVNEAPRRKRTGYQSDLESNSYLEGHEDSPRSPLPRAHHAASGRGIKNDNKDRLVLVDKVNSGGDFPVSLTLNHDLLYVLNSGGDGNITGFELGRDGRLTPIEGSTRSLDAADVSGLPFFLVSPAQVGFSPSGDFLVVTVKGTNEIRVFWVDEDGLPSRRPEISTSNGTTPFSFVFSRRGDLIVVEAFGTSPVIGVGAAGAASSYDIEPDGSLAVISGSVPNFQTATCWIVASPRGRFVYTTNNGSNSISGYRIGRDGSLSLLNADGVSADTGRAPVDVAITPSGRFLYNVNALDGTVSAFKVNKADGSLTSLGEIGGLPEDGGAVGIAAR